MKAHLAAALLAALAPAAAAAKTGPDTKIFAVNNDGVVAGVYASSTPGMGAFEEQGGTYADITYPGASALQINGLNDSGEIVGMFSTCCAEYSYVKSGAQHTMVEDPAAPTWTYAYGVNDAGEIVGYYYVGSFNGFTEVNSTYTTVDAPASNGTLINGVSSNGYLTGTYFVGAARIGYLDEGGTFTSLVDPLATPNETHPAAVNASGDVVGTFEGSDGDGSFLYADGVYTTIVVPGSTPHTTVATGINDLGEIVGYYTSGDGTYGFTDFGGTFTTISDPSSELLPLVPEPSTWALLVIGLGAAGGGLRLARRSAAAVRGSSRSLAGTG